MGHNCAIIFVMNSIISFVYHSHGEERDGDRERES